MFYLQGQIQVYFFAAVLSALKVLQDKIRKLELERYDAEKKLKSLATETNLYKVNRR